MVFEQSMAGALPAQGVRAFDPVPRARSQGLQTQGQTQSGHAAAGLFASVMGTASPGVQTTAALPGAYAGAGASTLPSGVQAPPAQTSMGQARAQALETLRDMLENSSGGDTLSSMRNSLSNMALADLTRLTQSETGAALLDGAGLSANTAGQAATAPLNGIQMGSPQLRTGTHGIALSPANTRFDIQFVERIRTPMRAARGAGENGAGGTSSTAAAHSGEFPGSISAQFESGGAGIAAIGYDRTGGTSYGKYQIAAKPGSMDAFVKFLKTEAPDLAQRLEKAGPADTGGKSGAMPDEWKAIAAEQPERFERLQDAFIAKSHYEPALNALSEATGVKASEITGAMKEALWSTAVQHGPSAAARIFSRAVDRATAAVRGSGGSGAEGTVTAEAHNPAEQLRQSQESVIREVYDIRATQFGSSSSEVRASVKNRLTKECDLVLAYAAGEKQNSMA